MALEFKIDEREFNPVIGVAAIPLLAMGLSFVICHQRWSYFIIHTGDARARAVLMSGAICLAWHLGACFFLNGSKNKLLWLIALLFATLPVSFVLPLLPFFYGTTAPLVGDFDSLRFGSGN